MRASRCCSAASLITALFGMYWDISLHIDNGRDPGPLAHPAHYFILAGLFGISCVSDTHCVAVGGFPAVGTDPPIVGTTDGEVYTSDDAADSWSRVSGDLTPISKGSHYRIVTEPPHTAAPV